MKTVENVVEYAELCSYAEKIGLACYNSANDLLYKLAYPYPESPQREVELSEMKYYEGNASEILSRFMTDNNVNYITVIA
jgi:hypothetical protein